MIDLILGQDELVAEWAKARIPDIQAFGHCAAIGYAIDGQLVGASVYNNYRHPNIEMSLVIEDKKIVNRRTIGAALAYPFFYVGVQRVTLLCAKSNRQSRSMAERIGFILEGKLRHALPNKESIIIYGMTMDEFRKSRWVKSAIEVIPNE